MSSTHLIRHTYSKWWRSKCYNPRNVWNGRSRGAAGSSRMPTTEHTTPQWTTPGTRLIDTKSSLHLTPYHGDKASFLGWTRSFLTAVRAMSKPLREGFKKISSMASPLARTNSPECDKIFVNVTLEPTFTSPDPCINLRQWNKNVRSMRHEPANAQVMEF